MKKCATILLVIFCCLFFIQSVVLAQTRPKTLSHKKLPRVMTPEERMEAKRSAELRSFMRALAPPTVRVNHPAEFDDQVGILLRWDYGYTDFEDMYCDMIDAIQDVAVVYILYRTTGQKNYAEGVLTSHGVPLTNLEWINARTDSIWARDYGPFGIYKEDSTRGITDFLYYPSRPNDNGVPHALSMLWGWEIFQESTYFEGGNFMSDGLGNCFLTDSIYSSNPGLTRQDIDDIFRDYCGCNTTHVLTALLGTIGHIDMFAKLLDVDTVMICEVPSGDPNYTILEKTVEFFRSLTAGNGNPYEILRVPMLSGFRTYTNSLLVNGTALVPTYTEPEDTAVLNTYTAAGFTAVPIESTLIIPLSGATHCITKEIPVPCSPVPTTPTGVTATDLGNNRIEIAWTDTGAPSYYIYRSTTDCDTDMNYFATVLASPFVDSNADNAVTYYYKVCGVDGCFSDLSACFSETGRGYCLSKPDFAGLTTVTNQHATACSIKLEWDPATPVCGTSVVYNVYRSDNPDFIPSPMTMIASCLTATEFVDSYDLNYRQQYFYLVRAEDDSGSGRGNCGCGNEDDNFVVMDGVATGSSTPGTYTENFESGPNGWVAEPAGLWHLADNSPCVMPSYGYYSPTHAWYYGQDTTCNYDTGNVTFGYIVSPVITGVSSTSNLSFYYYRYVEPPGYWVDETSVEVSADGGRSWEFVWYKSSNNASPDVWVSSGNISLADYDGSNIILRFGFNSYDDWYNDYPGWYVDDIQVTNVEIPSPCTTTTSIPVWSNTHYAIMFFLSVFTVALIIRKSRP